MIWKQIRHSVILIDEPELHLHPSLAFRLIETLKNLGAGTNQLILFTHSTDLISTYYATGNVYFIDLNEPGANQARRLSDLHDGHVATARAVGANLGLFAVGKKLVFVEGRDASVDRLTYHKVAQQCFPEAHLLPMGSVKNINALRDISEELSKAIFGVDLFMIRDRDGLTEDQVTTLEANPRFRVLPCRHVENFFLDAKVLSRVAERFCLPPAKSDVDAIETALAKTAEACLNQSIVAEIKHLLESDGSIDIPNFKGALRLDPDALVDAVTKELTGAVASLSRRLSDGNVSKLVRDSRVRLSAALRDGTWKSVFPGKTVLAQFAGQYWNLDLAAVRQAYVDIALAEEPDALGPIREILEGFKRVA